MHSLEVGGLQIIKHIAFAVGVFTLFLAVGCSPAPKPEPAIVDTVQTSPPAIKKILEFRNCRAILTAQEHTDHKTKEISIIFSIDQNPDYKAELGDHCKGNLVNLWQDLEQYDRLIEKHGHRIKHFTFIAPRLEYFPETYRELVLFVDHAAKANRDKINPEQYSRKVLEDVLKLRREYFALIRQETAKYFESTHAPIINQHLAKYGLKMKPYDAGEKLSFCYMPWDNCIYFFNPDKDFTASIPEREMDILYIASWDWWKVEPVEE